MQWAHQQAYDAVQTGAGLFTLAHKSALCFRSEDVCRVLEKLLCCRVYDLEAPGAGYGLMLNPQGGVLQDAFVLRLSAEEYWLIVNEKSRAKVCRHIQRQLPGTALPEDLNGHTSLLAAVGPRAAELLGLAGSSGQLQVHANIGGVECLACALEKMGVSCVVMAVPSQHEQALSQALCSKGIQPCESEVLDTLLLEAGVPVYGQEMDDTINPLEVGLSAFLRKERPIYIGRDALVAAGEPRRGLIGLRLSSEGAAHGMAVVKRDKDVGMVTSVGYSPKLGGYAAVALVEKPYRDPGRKLYVETPDGLLEAQVTALPMQAGDAGTAGKA